MVGKPYTHVVATAEPQRNKDINEEHCRVCLNICLKGKKWFQMGADFGRLFTCFLHAMKTGWQKVKENIGKEKPAHRYVKPQTKDFSFLSFESLIIFYSSHLILIFSSLTLNKNVNKLPIRQHKSIIKHNLPNYSMFKR